jgi:dinuclear metal center YbgI/SA1388 family protein
MKISEIIQHLEAFAPPDFQEAYDNSGIISGNPEADCTGILVSLDCIEEIIREAIARNCNLIVSHHPLIFSPIRRITTEDSQGRTLTFAIKNGITIYAMHTNLDNILSGVNSAIADKIGLRNREILLPRENRPAVGSGMIGKLAESLSENDFLLRLQASFHIPAIRHSPLTGRGVSTVAICGGAGSFLISNALQAGAEFFVSADIKYHAFFEGEGRMVIADIGHFESEQFSIDLICQVLVEKYRNFAVLKTDMVTNPVKYYI